MKIYRRCFKTTTEVLEFCDKVMEYGHPYSVLGMYTEDGKDYIEYAKLDGKEEVTIHFTPWDE